MAGRQAHGGPPAGKSKAKGRLKSKKRSLDAIAIASKTDPDLVKVKRHRLGAVEEDVRPSKRRKHGEDSAEEDENRAGRSSRSRHDREQSHGSETDAGSDSEGNEWKLGHVDDEDDSDIDSDDAFGESDEERYGGFNFSGSTSKQNSRAAPEGRNLVSEVTLHEDEQADHAMDTENSEEGLGEDAVDLAAVLDAAEEDEAEEGRVRNPKVDIRKGPESDFESEESSDESQIFSTDDEDASDPAKLAALQDLIADMSQPEQPGRSVATQRNEGTNELSTPSDFGLKPRSKLTLDDLSLSGIKDPHIKNSLKLLGSDVNGKLGRKVVKSLEVPLPRRQQARLDRTAAYEKTKEVLGRWTDTVKHNRQADHLMFPLPNPALESVHANTRLQPTAATQPMNELEATIQSILQESGLATVDGKDDEDHIRAFEDLATQQMSMEEARARQDQLRMARELLFREEVKAKRIKKIKSKSYRKVHRKQREKEERQNQEALLDGGFEPSEDEMEAQDRRRAEERMGQRHRGSKWAKSAKAAGRTAWDEEARSGITELARRDEALRKRVEGRVMREEGQRDSDPSGSSSYEDGSDENEFAEQKHILRQVDKLENGHTLPKSGPGSNLANMKFMLKAEEARKKANADMLESIRKDLAGDASSSEAEDLDVGRRKFGANGGKGPETQRHMASHNDFEEPLNSDEETLDDPKIESHRLGKKSTAVPRKSNDRGIRKSNIKAPQSEASEGGAWSRARPREDIISQSQAKRNKQKTKDLADVEELDLSQAAVMGELSKEKKTAKTTTLEVSSDEDSEGGNTSRLPFVIQNPELIKRAFAGADVVGEFETEKEHVIEAEDDKVIDNTLPGWGNWVGDGVSRRDKQQHKGRFLTKVEGIKKQNRKDAKLDRVIINEKHIKKNGKYLASTLPHPFESKQQYERSLRLPVGPEWATKETFNSATKPRVLLKQGIIAPMSKPLL